LLYVPGSNLRALQKAKELSADAFIFDLEDAVSPDKKSAARTSVAEIVAAGGFGPRTQMVRINSLESTFAKDDLAAICAAAPAAILLPKVHRARDIQKLDDFLDGHSKCSDTVIWAMMESPLCVLNAQEIASSSARLKGFVLGTNDLAKDLHAHETADRAPMITSLGICLVAARAYGLVCVDGVYNKFRDDDGLKIMCRQGRDFGFDGKTVIHPSQIDIVNGYFAPKPDEIELAKRRIVAFDQAMKTGQGIAVLDGNIVENLHVESARQLLVRADAIAQMES